MVPFLLENSGNNIWFLAPTKGGCQMKDLKDSTRESGNEKAATYRIKKIRN